jgi:hypothetical protein
MFEFMIMNTILQTMALQSLDILNVLTFSHIGMIMWLLHIVESFRDLMFQVQFPANRISTF